MPEIMKAEAPERFSSTPTGFLYVSSSLLCEFRGFVASTRYFEERPQTIYWSSPPL